MRHLSIKQGARIDKHFAKVFLPILILGVIGWGLYTLWYIILPIILMGVGLGIFLRIRRNKKLAKFGTFYTSGKHCPNCGHFNDIHYPMGHPTRGIKVTCNKCGRDYS